MKTLVIAVGFAFMVGAAVGWLVGEDHRKKERDHNPLDLTENIQIVASHEKGHTYTPFLIRVGDEAKPVYQVDPPTGAKRVTIKFHNNAVVIHATVDEP